MKISILVPVLARPKNVAPLVKSIRDSEEQEHEILFLCSPGDTEEIAACNESGEHMVIVDWEAARSDFPKKINRGFNETSNPFVLIAGDDLRFHPGWDTALLKVADKMGAAVIGSNDMGNPRVKRQQYATHPLVRRSYVKQQGGSADGPGVLLHEGYDHNYTDRELWDVAASRRLTAFAPTAKIEHLHPYWGKGKMDETYEKAKLSYYEDQHLYWTRSVLWGKELTASEKNWKRRADLLAAKEEKQRASQS